MPPFITSIIVLPPTLSALNCLSSPERAEIGVARNVDLPARIIIIIWRILELQIVFLGNNKLSEQKEQRLSRLVHVLETRYYLYKYFRGRFAEAPRRYGHIYSQRRSCILPLYAARLGRVRVCLCVCASVNLFGTCVYICTPIIELWFVYFVAKQNLLAMKTSNGFQLDTFIRSQLKCCPTRFPSFSVATDRYVHLNFFARNIFQKYRVIAVGRYDTS